MGGGVSLFLEDTMNDILSLLERLPEELGAFIGTAAEMIPANVDILSVLKLILVIAAASVAFGVIGRVAFGRHSDLNCAVSSSIAILFLYVLTVVVYTFRPWNLDSFLSPLPMVAFQGDRMYLLPFQGAEFTLLCGRVLDLVILAFLVNLLDTVVPRGKSVLGWYFLRLLSVFLCFILYFFLNRLVLKYLPGVLATYAPAILLCILVGMLLLGVINAIFSALVIAVNPILGAIYAFFFSNVIGMQLSKAVLTTVILGTLGYLLERWGYTVIAISAAALPAYLPLIAAVLVLWYLVGHIL